MKLWMRKTFVTLVAIMTLGAYVPPIAANADATEHKDISSNENSTEKEKHTGVAITEGRESTLDGHQTFNDRSQDDYVSLLLSRAQEKTMTKFGSKIASQIEEEFTENILPVMGEVIKTVIQEAGEDAVPYYAITEFPSRSEERRVGKECGSGL